MSRIAFVWELGSSYGHISRLLPYARKLKQRGHQVMLVLRELHHAAELLNEDMPILQAPIWLPIMQGLAEPPISYSEIMMRYGHFAPNGLAGLVGAWRDLFSLLNCDLIVADHAPTALLAARSMGLASATLGNGFLTPPRRVPLPSMRPWLNVPQIRLEASDARVLDSMNTVLSRFGARPLRSVSELFETEENFLCTFPELDHYVQRGAAVYWGAISNMQRGLEVAWPTGEGACVFVYLAPNGRDFIGVMDALAALDARAIVCAPGISGALLQRYASPRCLVSGRLIRLDRLVSKCDLAIGYAGFGLTTGMLLAGVPLLLFPTHLEQFLLGLRVSEMGAGAFVHPDAAPPDYRAVIRHVLETPGYRERAQAFASKYANFDQAQQQQDIAKRMEQIACRTQVSP